MFNKLRTRFLIVNLVTISIIMLAAFAAIYIFTYRNVQGDIDMALHRIADMQQRGPGDGQGPRGPGGGGGPAPWIKGRSTLTSRSVPSRSRYKQMPAAR